VELLPSGAGDLKAPFGVPHGVGEALRQVFGPHDVLEGPEVGRKFGVRHPVDDSDCPPERRHRSVGRRLLCFDEREQRGGARLMRPGTARGGDVERLVRPLAHRSEVDRVLRRRRLREVKLSSLWRDGIGQIDERLTYAIVGRRELPEEHLHRRASDTERHP
jgi:hypothetical protein